MGSLLSHPKVCHLVIIPDKNCQHIPWETIPILLGKPVSRLPSFEFLETLLGVPEKVSLKKSFVLLNPLQDLAKTQAKFENIIDDKWTSVVGRIPSKEEFLVNLEKSELFMYFGHGGGEAFISQHQLSSLTNVPVTLLFGCSSGLLKPDGEFDPDGIALEYLKAGSRAVLGNLWDVTDVDIDKFATCFLETWGVTNLNAPLVVNASLVESVAVARKACNLKYLVGAAPVLYGLPLYISK
jgi:separase